MAKVNVSKNAIGIVATLNEQLFEAEQELEEKQRDYNAARWYLAAEQSIDNVKDLRTARKQLRVQQEFVESIQRRLDNALEKIYTL